MKYKIPGTLERGKNTSQRNIFQEVFKLKCKVDLQQFMSETSNEQTDLKNGCRSWSNLSTLPLFWGDVVE